MKLREDAAITRSTAASDYQPRAGSLPALVIDALRKTDGPMRTAELQAMIGMEIDADKLTRAINAGLLKYCVVTVPGKQGKTLEYRLGQGVPMASQGTLKPRAVVRREAKQPPTTAPTHAPTPGRPVLATDASTSTEPTPPRMPRPMGEHAAVVNQQMTTTSPRVGINVDQRGTLDIWPTHDALTTLHIDNPSDLRRLAILASAAADLALERAA
jgi:hypothetical protein